MELFPITLGIRRTPDAERSHSGPQKLDKNSAEKTLRRDDFTCRFCGFRAEQYQRIVPYEKAGDPPFATACGFCEQCMVLDRTGMAGAGVLIWLPEISQAELNHIMRAIYVARSGVGDVSTAAGRALDSLMTRRAEAKKRLGVDDPLLLATVMHESLDDDEYRLAGQKLEGIRLLPLDKHFIKTAKGSVNQFPQMVKYWQSDSGPFAKLPPNHWPEIYKSVSAATGNA